MIIMDVLNKLDTSEFNYHSILPIINFKKKFHTLGKPSKGRIQGGPLPLINGAITGRKSMGFTGMKKTYLVGDFNPSEKY